MTPTSAPSPTELALLKHLWTGGELSARELHDAAGEELGWTFSSTRRTLDRMIEKGLVAVSERHGVKVFAAAAPKVQTIAGLARDFLTRVMEMDAPPVAAFTGGKLLSDDEAAELERLLTESAGTQRGSETEDGR
jgi:predicted transcriptional regulator